MSSSRKTILELRAQPIDQYLSGLVEVPPDSTLTKIIGLLREHDVYEVFLPEGNRCGMLSARDLLRTANIETTKPSSLMSHVPVLPRNSTVGEAARLMADYRMRSMPVSDGQRIIGQVNSSRLLSELVGRVGRDMRITSIATKEPAAVETESSVAKARALMIRKKIDHLPVTHEGRLAGILTSFDILFRISPAERIGRESIKAETRRSFDFPVREAMNQHPLVHSTETSVELALESMLKAASTYVLVTQWDELQAIATYRDFMTLLAEPESEADIPIFMVGLPDDPFEAEAAKAKFKRTINQLHRIFPDILEARSVIKSKFTKPGKERGRYEVSVSIKTSRRMYTYSDGGWELPAVYDLITDRLKRLMTQKLKPRRLRARERTEAV